MRYVSVFIQNNINKIDQLYTYTASDELEVSQGKRVLVPFGKGNRTNIGVVVNISDKSPDTKYKLKSIIEVIDYEPIINEDLIETGKWMVNRYLTTYGQSFSPMLPPGDIKKIIKVANIKDHKIDLSTEEIELLKKIEEEKFSLDNFKEEFEKRIIKSLVSKNKIEIDFKLETIGGKKYQRYVELSDGYLKKLSDAKLTDKQYEVVEYLQKNSNTLKSELLKNLNISDSPVKTLVKKGIVFEVDKEVYREYYTSEYKTEKHILNQEQLMAVNGILNNNSTTSLIHGMTGSGKTEVYLKLTEKIIESGGQVIILVPEIGLTPQTVERFKGRFKDRVSVMHSKLSMGERYDSWQKVKNGEVDVVVGVRSAVFAPFKNLKMIIIDEEHDTSYRFHNALRYDTIEVAQKRMEIMDGKVVLGSATPDVSSYYDSLNKNYELYELNKRARVGSVLPKIEVVDMREELIRGNTSIFSERLRELISEKLKNKEQIILFLNRRGFSNFVSCRSCGHVIKCDNCDISMTYHKGTGLLRCHYCGNTKKMVTECPECGSKFIKQFGIGTQKVEEEVLNLFPEARVLRMDKDTTVAKSSYEDIYEKVKNHEVDILVGTQMIAKGLDFENVTLVGVIAADLSLYISDYRAQETTYELLTQVSGRAGRSNKAGNVVIQTYTPENHSIECSKNSNYKSFYEEEIKERKEFSYPPFVDLIDINFSSPSDINLEEAANYILYEIGKQISGFVVEYTRVIPMPRIKNIYKVKFTLKVSPKNREKLTDIIKRVLMENKNNFESKKIFIDIEFKRWFNGSKSYTNRWRPYS